MTKKNRLAPTSSLGDRGSADLPNTHVEGEPEEHEPEAEPGPNDAKEGQTVGEVRRKVEKMTYEEGSGGPGNTKAAAPIGSAGRETITGDAEMVRTDTGDDSAEWEKIDKAEVEVEADDVQSGGDGLKRKAPDQCESSLAQGNGGGEGVKRQKDTPSVCPPLLSLVPQLTSACLLATIETELRTPPERAGSTEEAPNFLLGLLVLRLTLRRRPLCLALRQRRPCRCDIQQAVPLHELRLRELLVDLQSVRRQEDCFGREGEERGQRGRDRGWTFDIRGYPQVRAGRKGWDGGR